MRYAFIAMILGLVLPFSVLSVLSDLDKRKFSGLVAFSVGCALTAFLIPSVYYSGLRDWLAAGDHLPVLGLSVLVLIVLVSVSGPVLHRRSASSSLDWPRSVSQGEMQKLGAAYLVRHGWQVEPLNSFSGISVYRCRKNELRMFCLFLRDPMPFERLVRNISGTAGIVIRNVVAVVYDKPPPGLVDASRRASITTISIKDLESVDLICRKVEEERLASRSRDSAGHGKRTVDAIGI